MKNLWSYLFGKKDKNLKVPPSLVDHDGTKPIPFGIKCIWLAVKTNNHHAVCGAMPLKEVEKTDWVQGILRSHEGEIFVTPAIEGWTLVKGWGLPLPDCQKEEVHRLLNTLSIQFEEAYLFGNHRVSSSVVWIKSVHGVILREFVFGDGPGYQTGEPSELEKSWKLMDPFNFWNGQEMEENQTFPDENHVIQLAELWSINPLEIKDKIPNADFGYIGVYI